MQTKIEEIDLFDHWELLPMEVQEILNDEKYLDESYDNCKDLIQRLESAGYTCDYDLSAQPFGLKKLEI